MITPVDIKSKTFKSGIGYDKRDVDAFMSDILVGYEELYRSNVEMKDKITVLNDSLQHYKTLEASLQKALMLAEKTSEETLKTAEDKAKSIELEAVNKAKEYTANSKIELERVHNQTVTLVQQYIKFKAQFNQLLNTQVDLLNSVSYDMESGDLSAFINSQASMNDKLNSSNPMGGFGNNDSPFGSFGGDPQMREESSLGGLGGDSSMSGSGFSSDGYDDPRTTSAGSELSGVSLLNNDPFAPKLSFKDSSTSYADTSRYGQPVQQAAPQMAPQYGQPVQQTAPQMAPQYEQPVQQVAPQMEPQYEQQFQQAAPTMEESVELYDDVFVGDVEDKVDRRNLIGDGDDPDAGFEFI